VPSSSTASSPYAQRQRNPRKHLASIAGVVVLHGLLLWALQSGLAQHVVKITEVKVVAMLLSDNVPPPPAPPQPTPPPPKTPPPPAAAPVPVTTDTTPVITVPVAPAAPPSPAPAVIAPPAPAAPVAPPVPAIRTGASIQAGASCTKPDYPSASRRLEEEGTVTLKFLIGVDGRVLQAEIEKTSGFNRLDEAARNALSKCQFRPGTVDGKPEQSWATIKYTWRLE
jgi:protein TonB